MAGVRYCCKVLKLESGDEFDGIIGTGGGGDFRSGVEYGGGIELIEGEGRDETRLAGGQGLGAGAESSMVDDCGGG